MTRQPGVLHMVVLTINFQLSETGLLEVPRLWKALEQRQTSSMSDTGWASLLFPPSPLSSHLFPQCCETLCFAEIPCILHSVSWAGGETHSGCSVQAPKYKAAALVFRGNGPGAGTKPCVCPFPRRLLTQRWPFCSCLLQFSGCSPGSTSVNISGG